MNDNDLSLALDRLVTDRKRVQAPPTLHERVWAIPTTTPEERRWVPRIDTGGFTMFSALKFVAAAAIVALFGGFLLTGVLTTPQEDVVVPAAPSSETDAFPTGTFVALDRPELIVEFREDGTGRGKSYAPRWENHIRYATNGDLFTEMTHEGEGPLVPATYYWDFDGEILNFEVWGEDVNPGRASTYANSFRLVENPVEVVIAAVEIPAGETVYSTWVMTGIASTAEAGPEFFLDASDVFGRVAAHDIQVGQPITPGLLEPSVE